MVLFLVGIIEEDPSRGKHKGRRIVKNKHQRPEGQHMRFYRKHALTQQ